MVAKKRDRNMLPIVRKTNGYTIALIIVFTFFTFFRLYNAMTAGLMYDEPETLYNAEQLYQGKLPFVDYFEHHPIISYILLTPFAGISTWEYQRIFVAILSIVSAIFLYFFIIDIFDKKIAILCSITFLVSPLLNRMSIMIIPDSFMIFFFIMGLYFYGRILKNSDLNNSCSNNCTDFFILGLSWSLSILSKISSIVPIVIFTLLLTYRFKSWKNIFYMLIGYFVPIVTIFTIYHFNIRYIYLMTNGMLSNVYVRQYTSQSLHDRIEILINQVIYMYIYLWIVAIIGFIYSFKMFLNEKSNILKDKLKDYNSIIILSTSVSFFLLIYYNLRITVDSWPHYYMMEEILLIIMSVGFYEMVQKHLHRIYRYYRYKTLLTMISIILILFGFVQPFMMSTYPYQPNNHKEERSLVNWLTDENNINRNKYVFENWIYFNYLANLKSDYKIPVFSDATFYYLTSINNSFTDHLSLRKNVYENSNYDTVIFHEPMFDDLFVWIDTQFDKQNWYLAKRYNIAMVDYKDQILFWYPGFKVDTYVSQIDIWKRKPMNYVENMTDDVQDDKSLFSRDKISFNDDNGSIILDSTTNWK